MSEKPISDIPLGEIYVLSYLRNHKVDLKSGECIVISNGSPQIVNQEAAGSLIKGKVSIDIIPPFPCDRTDYLLHLSFCR